MQDINNHPPCFLSFLSTRSWFNRSFSLLNSLSFLLISWLYWLARLAIMLCSLCTWRGKTKHFIYFQTYQTASKKATRFKKNYLFFFRFQGILQTFHLLQEPSFPFEKCSVFSFTHLNLLLCLQNDTNVHLTHLHTELWSSQIIMLLTFSRFLMSCRASMLLLDLRFSTSRFSRLRRLLWWSWTRSYVQLRRDTTLISVPPSEDVQTGWRPKDETSWKHDRKQWKLAVFWLNSWAIGSVYLARMDEDTDLADAHNTFLHIVLCAERALDVGSPVHQQWWLAELRKWGSSAFKRGAASTLDIWKRKSNRVGSNCNLHRSETQAFSSYLQKHVSNVLWHRKHSKGPIEKQNWD